ncbi:MAG: hypothetical protein PHD02_00880 [Bacilli bacterium]|nr:hypothetical protein [Bacilli bacterium]
MGRLNEILHELGISKVKLAKFLGVSRQMIYNYLELDDINKWPKDKKVLLLNLLGIKSPNELDKIKVDTDYILDVESRINNLFQSNNKKDSDCTNEIYNGLGKKQQELLKSVIDIVKEKLEDDKADDGYNEIKYFYHYIQAIDNAKELKYILGYVSKAMGFIKPLEFVFNEDEQFTFESIMYSAMTLYNNGGASKSKLIESHRRFVTQIEHKIEEKLSRTMELNTIKVQALKELGYTEITETNAAEVFEKIAEIQSRKVAS